MSVNCKILENMDSSSLTSSVCLCQDIFSRGLGFIFVNKYNKTRHFECLLLHKILKIK